MKTTTARTVPRNQTQLRFAAPLILDPPRHCGLPPICLGQGKHVLGTSEDCTIRVQAEGVQPRHALIIAGEQRTVVKALDVRTWVNEGPVSEMALRHGDRLSIGPLTFRVRAASPDEISSFVPSAGDTTLGEQVSEQAELTPWFLASQAFTTTEPVTFTEISSDVTDLAAKPLKAVALTVPSASPSKFEPIVATATVQAVSTTVPDLANPWLVKPPSELVVHHAASVDSTDDLIVSRPHSDGLDLRLDEIQRKLAELRQSTLTPTAPPNASDGRADARSPEHDHLQQPDDWQRRADELARQAQQLDERSALLAEREAEVDRRQAALTEEHERFVTAAEATRRELNDEYTRQASLWQESDTAYRRTSEELSSQLQALEQRRAGLAAEADRLSVERSELQRLQAEHERDRRSLTDERTQLATDRAAQEALRIQVDAERQQQLATMSERETQMEVERRTLAQTQEELLDTRHQLERDRAAFLAERSAEALRREHEFREHSQLRAQLDGDLARQRGEREELASLRLEFEAERMAFDSEQANAASVYRELADLRSRLQWTEAELALLRGAREAGHLVASTCTIERDAQPMLQPPPVQTEAISPAPETYCDESRIAEIEVAPVYRENRDDALPSSWTPDVPTAPGRRFWEDYSSFGASQEPYSQSIASSIGDEGGADGGSCLPLSENASAPLPPPIPRSSFEGRALGEAAMSDAQVGDLEAQPRETVLAPWSHDDEGNAPYVASEFEVARAVATAIADSEPSATNTLAEVNREFGVALSDAVCNPPAAQTAELPAWWNASLTADSHEMAVAPSLDSWRESSANRFTVDSSEVDSSESATRPSNPDDTLSSLRAQLAQMFDIKPGPSTSEDSVRQTHDDLEMIAPSAEIASAQNDPLSRGLDEPVALFEIAPVEPAATPVESKPVVEPRPVPAITPAEATETNHEDSVETFMARLLARSRGENETAAAEAAVSAARSQSYATTTPQAPVEVSEATAPAETVDLSDRSHLKAEPKHKQDRQAAREHLQSFREVAHQSARSALARHTSKHLKNAVIVKSVLFGASTLAAATFLGGSLTGTQPQIWKGMACSLAMLLSAIELGRSWLQLRRWKSMGKSSGEIAAIEATVPQAESAKDLVASNAIAD